MTAAAGWVAGIAALALAAGTPSAAAQAKPKAPRAAASGAASAPAAANYAQRFATLCAACHGANGRSDQPLMPQLAGQPSLYAITQLFLFREGRRPNEAMTAVARTMTDDDLRGFSDFIGTLPPVPAPAPASPSDAARMTRGQALAQQHKCVFCHGADFAGGQQVPRLAGQREDYLRLTLHGFKDGTRPGYTRAMPEALSQVPPEELDILAYYVARVAPAPAK